MKNSTLPLFLLTVISFTGYAQRIDEQFKPSIVTSPEITAMAVQSDGKIILAGNMVQVGNTTVNRLIKLNADGTLDESFIAPEFITDQSYISTILQDSDGKILIGGYLTEELSAVRLNEDGSLDDSFTLPGVIEQVVAITHYTNNRYLVLSYGAKPLRAINADGSIDTSFDAGTGPQSMGLTGTDFIVQADGKIIFGGTFKKFNGTDQPGIVRLNPNGSIDETFSAGVGAQASHPYINTIALQEDGRILLAGRFDNFNNSGAVNIVRLNPDGSVDNTFVMPGPAVNYFDHEIGDMVVSPNGIFLAGLVRNSMTQELFYSVLKLKEDGALDTQFATLSSDMTAYGAIEDPLLAVSGDDVLLTGLFSMMGSVDQRGISRLDKMDGTMDPSFKPALGGMAEIRVVKEDADGKVLIGGRFHFVGGTRVNNLARLNVDGSADLSFVANLGSGPDGVINSIEIDEDGKILVGGTQFYYDDDYTGHLVRLDVDGTRDKTFTARVFSPYVGLGVNRIMWSPQQQGKIIIAGFFHTVNNQTQNHIALLNADGSTDRAFNRVTLGKEHSVNSIVPTSDGNFLVGGRIRNGGGFIHKIDPYGNLLDDFLDVDLSNQAINVIQVLDNGNFLAAGDFAQYFSDTAPNSVYQFNSDGTLLDKISVAVYRGGIFDIKMISADEPLLGGSFKKVNTSPSTGFSLVRLNGQMNASYHFKVDGYVRAIYQPKDGLQHYYVGGRFSNMNGIRCFGLVRINMLAPATPTELAYNVDDSEGEVSLSWADHSIMESGFEILRAVDDVFTAIDTTDANTTSFVDLSALPLQIYTYKVRAFADNNVSDYSNDVNVSTAGWVPPSAPLNLAFELSDYGTATISWTDVSTNEQGFELERALGDSDFFLRQIVDRNVTAFDDDFSFGIRNTYRIRAFNKFGKSEYSSITELPIILDAHDPVIAAPQLYPNPAADVLFIKHGFQTPLRVIVSDIAGRIFHDQVYTEKEVSLSMRNAPPNIYVVRLQTGLRSSVHKVNKR